MDGARFPAPPRGPPVFPAAALLVAASWDRSLSAQGGRAGAVSFWLTLGVGCVLRSEEHTSELQSQSNLVCRLLLEKKKRTPVTSLKPMPSAACTEQTSIILSRT